MMMVMCLCQAAFTDSEGDETRRDDEEAVDEDEADELIVLDPVHICDFYRI